MKLIDLQNKTKVQFGRVEKYWFENKNVGLKNTLFHRIYIPFSPFNSGLDYVEQPEETELVIEWLKLDLSDPDNLDGLKIMSEKYEDVEASIYIGATHNLCDIIKLNIDRIEGGSYRIDCELFIDFEREGVGENESFTFQTNIKCSIE